MDPIGSILAEPDELNKEGEGVMYHVRIIMSWRTTVKVLHARNLVVFFQMQLLYTFSSESWQPLHLTEVVSLVGGRTQEFSEIDLGVDSRCGYRFMGRVQWV